MKTWLRAWSLITWVAIPLWAGQPLITIHPFPRSVTQLIIDESIRVGLEPSLPLAIAYRESKFNPLAVHRNANRTQDSGVFQLNTHTVKVLHIAHPLNAQQNVIAGVGLIKAYIEGCGRSGAVWAFAHGNCPARRRK